MSYYDDASLVLIPSGVKAAKVYSQKPTNGSGDFTFARASTATRTNASGAIESVASGVPRLDYSDGATCPRLLLEPQRTNLAERSEQFDDAYWAKLDVTVDANTTETLSPDGTNNADKIVTSVGTASMRVRKISIGISTPTISIYAKAAGVRYLGLTFGGNVSTTATYDLLDGVITQTPTATGASALIQSVGNGWYRCILSSSVVTSFNFECNLFTSPTGNAVPTTIVGNGTDGVYLFGVQFETGSYATSYIPTTTAAVTRLAETCNKTGISSLIGQTEGVLFWEGIVTQQTDIIAINRSTVNGVYITKGTGNLYRCSIYNSSNVITLNDTIVRTTNTKIALAYKSGDSALFVNGIKVATSASAITFSGALSEIRLNDNYLIASAPQSANQIVIFNTRLTDAQCIELTTL